MNGPLLLLCLSVIGGPPALAAPFIPADDDQVLERRPAVNATLRNLRPLQEQWQARPDDASVAVPLARAYLQAGRSEADPRYYGYAQVVLQPWWEQPQPPAAVRVLRATLRQQRHEFAAALNDLDRALAADPHDAQAWLTRAVILQVQGNYAEARRSCTRLLLSVETLLFATCSSSVAGLNGQAEAAYRLLEQAVRTAPPVATVERRYALTVLAELAARHGDAPAADRGFQEALDVKVRDLYLLGAYADFLLDQGRFQNVRSLLAAETRNDGLLLRLALAERGLNDPAWREHAAVLAARFEAARLRGDDSVHLRELARATLYLQDRPQEALALALRNWMLQHEPADARLVVAAALAASRPEAARLVLDWLAATRLEDSVLTALAGKLREVAS